MVVLLVQIVTALCISATTAVNTDGAFICDLQHHCSTHGYGIIHHIVGTILLHLLAPVPERYVVGAWSLRRVSKPTFLIAFFGVVEVFPTSKSRTMVGSTGTL